MFYNEYGKDISTPITDHACQMIVNEWDSQWMR
jgi:hypothetical protein